MQVDTSLRSATSTDVEIGAAELEALGFSGLWSDENEHDPFLPLALAARRTSRVLVGTSITVAFARNPMTIAYTAYDLQVLAEGRFVLGLGSQVRSHIVNRFSMPWSHPAPRMRELILAVRAIWESWESGGPLRFEGEFYRHTLMTPHFSPGPNPFGIPKVFLAAVGPQMTAVAADVADGLLIHGFTTERYLREVTLPTIESRLAAVGRARDDFAVCYPAMTVTAMTEEAMREAIIACKRRIAFYGSTPAYLPVLELHGWGDLGPELNRLSKSDDPRRWDAMGELIDDEVLNAFAVVAEPDAIGAACIARFGDLADRMTLTRPDDFDGAAMTRLVRSLTESAGTTAPA